MDSTFLFRFRKATDNGIQFSYLLVLFYDVCYRAEAIFTVNLKEMRDVLLKSTLFIYTTLQRQSMYEDVFVTS